MKALPNLCYSSEKLYFIKTILYNFQKNFPFFILET
jgi:hypothetical protein